MKKTAMILAVLLAALTILAGCASTKNDPKDTTAGTKAESKVETKAETGDAATTEEAATEAKSEDSGASIPEDKIYADIWEQSAIEEAISRIGGEYMCVGTEKGVAPDGLDAWIISLRLIDDENAPVWKCYVGGKFCYLEEGAPDPLEAGVDIPEDKIYADIWEQYAINEAISRIGDEYMCVGTEKGAAPDGLDAWIVSLRLIDDENAPVWKCYVSGAFCYLEDGAPDPIDVAS